MVDEFHRLFGEWLSYIATQLGKVKYCQDTFAYYRVHKSSTMRLINRSYVKEIKIIRILVGLRLCSL